MDETLDLHSFATRAQPYALALDEACVRYQYSQIAAYTQIAAESAWDPNATSGVGAIGLCQIMPDTANAWGINPHDPIQSIGALVREMAKYQQTFANAIARGQYRNYTAFALALAAYNAGPGAVTEYAGIPPYEETENYVAKITATVAHSKPYWAAFWAEFIGS